MGVQRVYGVEDEIRFIGIGGDKCFAQCALFFAPTEPVTSLIHIHRYRTDR